MLRDLVPWRIVIPAFVSKRRRNIFPLCMWSSVPLIRGSVPLLSCLPVVFYDGPVSTRGEARLLSPTMSRMPSRYSLPRLCYSNFSVVDLKSTFFFWLCNVSPTFRMQPYDLLRTGRRGLAPPPCMLRELRKVRHPNIVSAESHR